MKLARPFLIFLNPLYALITWLRNVFFDIGLLQSTWFNHPVIVIGNLSTGGTGKTPHTEFLIKQLKNDYKLAVLSRGYGRKSRGYQEAGLLPLANLVGDEPAQIKQKFQDITVAVDANRVAGIKRLLAKKNKPEVVLLDDAFQHRWLEAGYYILLTPYKQPYTRDFLLPAGNLRELRAGASRAHCIIVTKCPEDLGKPEMDALIAELNPLSHQDVFFTTIKYAQPVGSLFDINAVPFLLVTGIADSSALVNHLQKANTNFQHVRFSDHHHFTDADIADLIKRAKEARLAHIVTTEKDFQRLPAAPFEAVGIKLTYIPIEVVFLRDEALFLKNIRTYIAGY